MVGFFIFFGIILGIVIALILNRFIANKIDNKHVRLGTKIVAYVVLIILGFFFGLVCSIKPSLNKFIDGKINTIEIILNEHFPNERVMEISISENDISEIVDQLQQSLKEINIGTDNYFQKIIFNAFVDRVNLYIDDVHRGINTVGTTISNDQGEISLKSILFNLKDLALNKITPYIVVFIILIIIVFIIFLGIYAIIVKSYRKRK